MLHIIRLYNNRKTLKKQAFEHKQARLHEEYNRVFMDYIVSSLKGEDSVDSYINASEQLDMLRAEMR